MSEPGSPSASRSSTPHIQSEDDDDSDETDNDDEVRRINSSSNNSERSFNMSEKSTQKSVEAVLKELSLKSNDS